MSERTPLNFKSILKKLLPAKLKILLSALRESVSFYPHYVMGRGTARPPESVSIEVTYLCNCRCKMCPLYGNHTHDGRKIREESAGKKELTAAEYKELFRDLRDGGVKRVSFTGGEPFIRSDMLEIVQHAVDLGLEVSFNTNGALLTREAAKSLIDLRVESIYFSLDGTEETHDNIRGAGVYKRLLEAIDFINEEKKLRGRSKPSISFGCVISRLNENNFSELVKIAKDKNAFLSIYPVFFSSEKEVESTLKLFPGEKFIKSESKSLPDSVIDVDVDVLYNETKRAVSLSEALKQPIQIVLKRRKDIERWFCKDSCFPVNKCFFPWASAFINPFGIVYPCSISLPMGDIRSSSFMKIWNGQKYREFRKRLKSKKLFPFCSRCCMLYPNMPGKLWNHLPKIGR
jgi:MoaA/NifB/PqqE/SkfB family radical SAM enzyme